MNEIQKRKYNSPKVKAETLKTQLFNMRSLDDNIGGFNLLTSSLLAVAGEGSESCVRSCSSCGT